MHRLIIKQHDILIQTVTRYKMLTSNILKNILIFSSNATIKYAAE